MYLQYRICIFPNIFETYNLRLRGKCVYVKYMFLCLQYIQRPEIKIPVPKTNGFGSKMGRHGSPRAHTLGKRSHGVQDHCKIGPGVQNCFKIKNIDFAWFLRFIIVYRICLYILTPDIPQWRLDIIPHFYQRMLGFGNINTPRSHNLMLGLLVNTNPRDCQN